MTHDDTLTARLAPVTLVVGKGGVGKTTVAAALANSFTKGGFRTLVVTTDPAGTLLAAFGRSIAPTSKPISVVIPRAEREGGSSATSKLSLWAIDTQVVRDEFLGAWREPITQILDRGTYLDVDDVRGLVDATLPGADEIFALLALGDVLGRTGAEAYERIVVDTAPTGHTLRLLNLPQSFAAVVRLLDAMQEKHRFMVRALTHRYRADAADALIAELRKRIETLQETLSDPRQTAAVLVTRPEPVVIAESTRYVTALEASHIAVAVILINTWHGTESERAAIAPLVSARQISTYTAPELGSDPVGTLLDQVELIELTATKTTRKPSRPERVLSEANGLTSVPSVAGVYPERSQRALKVDPTSLAKPLTIVAGKGGVGKTTVSCAIAIAVTDAGEKTLLVSTDPAPSIGDALNQSIGDDDTLVDGAANLWARQMDATAAFTSFRDEYQVRIDDLFENLTGPGMNIAHDRAILRDLLSLAPPGIDELYALTVLGDALEDGRYSCIIVDPAPTGHLLRLLDMPALAIAWSHQLMRMMLKYKEVVGLGQAAQDLLTFAKRTRALEQRLHDPAQGSAVLVSLDEPLVRGESERLLAALRDRGLTVGGIVWNRGAASVPPLPTDASVPQFFAPRSSPAPIGIAAIRAWSRSWGMTSSSW